MLWQILRCPTAVPQMSSLVLEPKLMCVGCPEWQRPWGSSSLCVHGAPWGWWWGDLHCWPRCRTHGAPGVRTGHSKPLLPPSPTPPVPSLEGLRWQSPGLSCFGNCCYVLTPIARHKKIKVCRNLPTLPWLLYLRRYKYWKCFNLCSPPPQWLVNSMKT